MSKSKQPHVKVHNGQNGKEPALTLKYSDRLAMQVAMQQLQAAQKQVAQVMTDVGMDPQRKWNILPDGKVYEIDAPVGPQLVPASNGSPS